MGWRVGGKEAGRAVGWAVCTGSNALWERGGAREGEGAWCCLCGLGCVYRMQAGGGGLRGSGLWQENGARGKGGGGRGRGGHEQVAVAIDAGIGVCLDRAQATRCCSGAAQRPLAPSSVSQRAPAALWQPLQLLPSPARPPLVPHTSPACRHRRGRRDAPHALLNKPTARTAHLTFLPPPLTQTYYGHQNSCNAVCFNITGTTLASTDADGVVKLWDTRMTAEILTLHTGERHAA